WMGVATGDPLIAAASVADAAACDRSGVMGLPVRSVPPPTTIRIARVARAPKGATHASPAPPLRRAGSPTRRPGYRGPERKDEARCSARRPRMDRAPRDPGTPPRPGN